MLREIKNRLRALVPPTLFLGITVYFGWNAMHGSRGLEAQHVQLAQLAAAKQAYAVTDGALKAWQIRINTLNGASIAGDMLDSEARLVLNLADPRDLVTDLPSGPAGK